MENAIPWGFWDYFAAATNVASWIGMAITLWTLFTTVGIKRLLLLYVEKSDYLEDIDNRIKVLRSFEETLKKDAAICGTTVYDWTIEQLDDILINYENLLKKNIVPEIRELIDLAEQSKTANDALAAANTFQRKLHALCTRMEKEKKLI